jgi:MtN3 and saliva related transmembrane protein
MTELSLPLSFSPTWIGIAAAVLTTAAYAPQAFKVWQTRSTRDVSLAMFLLMVSGIMLWLIYGILISDLPLIVANAVTLVLAASILIAKIRFR